MQPAAFECAALRLFRARTPLIHCMTNDVVQHFTANIISGLGGSPAMVIDAGEARQLAAVADALLINVGTLTVPRAEAMYAAVISARKAGKPWVLDPVAVGSLPLRTDFCHELLALSPAAIRGNASEIIALAQGGPGGRGVDSVDSAELALPAATALAQRTGAVVVVTGARDCITDGHTVQYVAGGHARVTQLIGTGCALSALVAGFCSLPGDRVTLLAEICRVMKYAAGQSAIVANGLGSFSVTLLDILSELEVTHAAD